MFSKKLLLPIFAAVVLGGAAFAGNTSLFSSSIGDVTFPFTAPARDGSAGAIDNMVIGATTPRAATFTQVNNTGGGAVTADSITGTDASLGIAGRAAAQGGAVAVVGGTSSTSANAGGAVSLTGGTPGATGDGGAASVTGGASGSTSGTGGTATLVGGAGTAGNSTGGAASVIGGAGHGTAAGATANLTGGASGDGSTGNGGPANVTGGSSTAANGNGGSVFLEGGHKAGSGVVGMLIHRSVSLIPQGAPAAKTTSATLTAAEVLTGIVTVAQGAGAASAQQLPAATAMDTAMPDSAAGDAFDFSVINISTTSAEAASVTTNAGWTLVGDMDIQANNAATTKSAGRFRARKTGTGAWVLYRLS